MIVLKEKHINFRANFLEYGSVLKLVVGNEFSKGSPKFYELKYKAQCDIETLF